MILGVIDIVQAEITKKTYTYLASFTETSAVEDEYTDIEALQYLVDSGRITMQELAAIKEIMTATRNKELLKRHRYVIYQGYDGAYYTHIKDEVKGRAKIRRVKLKDLEKVIIQHQRNLEENPTLQECFKEANDRRLELNKIAPSYHLRNERVFNRHFGCIKNKRIKSITPEYLCDFLEEQVPKFNMTAKDFSRLKGVVKTTFKRAKKRKLIDWNVEQVFMELDLSERAFKSSTKADCDEVYSEEETELIMKYLHENSDNIHDQGLLLLFITGLRIGELVALTPKDLIEDKETDTFSVNVNKTETRYLKDGKVFYEVVDHTKTRAGMRKVIVPPGYSWFLRKLRHQNPFGEYVFTYRGVRINAEGISRHLKRVCKKLGIKYRSPHKIRKTYASILATNCHDERFIIEQMGHVDYSLTRDVYIKNRKSDERKSEMLGTISEFQNRMVQ